MGRSKVNHPWNGLKLKEASEVLKEIAHTWSKVNHLWDDLELKVFKTKFQRRSGMI